MLLEAWYIAVLIYGREFKFYRIERDEEIISSLIQIEQDFWENHVRKGILPAPDGSKQADEAIAERFKEVSAKTIPLSGFDEKLKRRSELIVLSEKLERERKQIEQEIKLYLGEAEIAENEHSRVSWKAVTTNRIDAGRLKEEEPKYTGNTRRSPKVGGLW